MTATTVRRLDELGRIVLPIELRRDLKMEDRESIEIYVSSEGIVLRKYRPACVFCGESENVLIVNEKQVCKRCLDELKSL